MALARRYELLSWASRTRAWILEDDFGCEYRYSGRPIPSLQGLDTTGSVIYLGTLNTVLYTSLRMAYLVVPESLVDPLLRILTAQGHHSASVDQAVLADFIAEGHFTRHIRRMRTLYAARQAILVAAAKRHLKGLIDIEPDDAGMHLIGWLPTGVDDSKVAETAATIGVRLTPLSHFYAGKSAKPGVLFGYTCLTKHQVQSAIRRLAEVLKEFVSRAHFG